MQCENCDSDIAVRKSLKRGKSVLPDECPDCGADIDETQSPTKISK